MDNNRKHINCTECNKSYTDRRSLKRHLVGAHDMCFIPESEVLRVMTVIELTEAKVLLRNGQMRQRKRDRPRSPGYVRN